MASSTETVLGGLTEDSRICDNRVDKKELIVSAQNIIAVMVSLPGSGLEEEESRKSPVLATVVPRGPVVQGKALSVLLRVNSYRIPEVKR